MIASSDTTLRFISWKDDIPSMKRKHQHHLRSRSTAKVCFTSVYLIVASFPSTVCAFPIIILQTRQSLPLHHDLSVTCLEAATSSPIQPTPGRRRISTTKLGYRDSIDLQSPDDLRDIAPSMDINVEIFNASIAGDSRNASFVGELQEDYPTSHLEQEQEYESVTPTDCSRIHRWWNAIINKATFKTEDDSQNEIQFDEPNSQVRLDDYLESIDRRYKRMHHNELPVPTTNTPGFTSAWKWLKQGYSDGSTSSTYAKDPKQDDALYVLGLADLASADLLQKHHLPVPESKIKEQQEFRYQARKAGVTGLYRVEKSHKEQTVIDVDSTLAVDVSVFHNPVTPQQQSTIPNARFDAMQRLHHSLLRIHAMTSFQVRSSFHDIVSLCGAVFVKTALKVVQNAGLITGSSLPLYYSYWAFSTVVSYMANLVAQMKGFSRIRSES